MNVPQPPQTPGATLHFTEADVMLLTKRMRQAAYILVVLGLVLLFRWIKIPRDYLYLFDVAREVNFWTWLNVAYMLFAAQALALGAWLRRRKGMPATGLALASLALILLSMDDFMSFHEKLDPLGESLGGGSGFLQFAWVIPGSVIALIVIGIFVNALRSTARDVQRDLMMGVAFFFGGALGMEMISGAWLSAFGHHRPYTLLYHIEETFEALGIIFIARAALKDILRVSAAAPPRAPGGVMSSV